MLGGSRALLDRWVLLGGLRVLLRSIRPVLILRRGRNVQVEESTGGAFAAESSASSQSDFAAYVAEGMESIHSSAGVVFLASAISTAERLTASRLSAVISSVEESAPAGC